MELTPEILAKILALKEREEYWINKSEGGGAYLEKRDNWFHLYDVPQYGGEPRYYGCFKEDELGGVFETVRLWT